MALASLKKFLVGEPLANANAAQERIPNWKALSTLSSDALSSVAYATDAILFVLAAFSAAAVIWSIPIAIAITALLVIITASYRQTIEAYPGGGGAYTVAKGNLGTFAGLVAGASLLIDYILTVSVSVAAGTENIASAFPALNHHRVALCVGIVFLLMLMNLRGIRESATLFALPTYFFILSVVALLGTGFWRALTGDVPDASAVMSQAYPAIPTVLLLRAFASGCSALTGVEAISNSVPVFREPSQRNAKITLTWMAVILGMFFMGITTLAHVFRLVPKEDETLISLLGTAVFGKTWAYYALQLATALILFLAANTSYAGFPRLASLLARDRFLPRQLANLGDRLVFSNGIIGLSLMAAALLVMFKAETIHLLPLYALGVFLSFTLSQAGMVVHHLHERKQGWVQSLLVNGLGTTTTLVVLIDIASTKFLSGAWMVLAAIPVMVFFFKKVSDHYLDVGRELSFINVTPPVPQVKVRHSVVVPVSGIHQGVIEAIQYGRSISDDVRACYVDIDAASTDRMAEEWKKWFPDIPFVILKSPYRSVIEPLLRYLDDVEQTAHDDLVTVVIPEFVTRRWWHQFLHNHTALFIRAALRFKRGKVVTSVRHHLRGAGH